MIISASRKTDIPAFYSDWFMQQIGAGCTSVVNSYNGLSREVSLKPEDVDCFVFWTKNSSPMFKYLNTLDDMGYNYYFQFTLNDYPTLETNVLDLQKRIDTFKFLSNTIGKNKVIWRYDPLLLTDTLTIEDLLKSIKYIGDELHSYTDKLVFSFLDNYKKIPQGLYSPDDNQRNTIVNALLEMNTNWNLELATCAEAYDGVRHNACIDADLINELFGLDVSGKKDMGQRKLCMCAKSIDIGSYRTCKHGCKYCYAM